MSIPGQALSKPVVNKLINGIAKGQTIADTADQIGVSSRTVSRYKRNPKVREKIERIQREMADKTLDEIIEADKAIIKTAKGFVQDAKPIHYQDASVLMASYHKLSKGIKQSLGILPSPTPSIFLQTIYNDNRSQVLADNVLQLISQGTSQQSTVDNLDAFDMLTDDTTIDADLVDNS